MAENFPNLVNKADIQVQEAQRAQTRWTQRLTPKHITIKMSKDKGRILKPEREN